MGFRSKIPGLSLRSSPGLKLANAFGVSFQIQTDALPSARSSQNQDRSCILYGRRKRPPANMPRRNLSKGEAL